MKAPDWFVILLLAGVWIAATVFLFKHPEHPNFMTWCGLAVTMGGIYHWLMVRDQKIPDAHEPDH